ncbi:MAG: VTT domain-containing protein [Patescibacteria group bacterium]|jgi:uncharacterized membrane protein YdjX (TVP38/TMEM64 family)
MQAHTKVLFKNATSKKALLYIFLYIVFIVVVAFLAKAYIDREQLRVFIDDTGTLGMLVFGVLEYLYVVFVPINTTIHLIAGYLFGGNVGWVFNFVTTTAGLFTIVLLVKKYGRPLLMKIVSPHFLEQYDALAAKIGPFTLFAFYVLPLFPDDELTYVVAAANIRFSRFVLPILFGNITKAAISYVGAEGGGGFRLALGSRVVVFVIGGICIGLQEYWVQRRQRKLEQRDSRALHKGGA